MHCNMARFIAIIVRRVNPIIFAYRKPISCARRLSGIRRVITSSALILRLVMRRIDEPPPDTAREHASSDAYEPLALARA